MSNIMMLPSDINAKATADVLTKEQLKELLLSIKKREEDENARHST